MATEFETLRQSAENKPVVESQSFPIFPQTPALGKKRAQVSWLQQLRAHLTARPQKFPQGKRPGRATFLSRRHFSTEMFYRRPRRRGTLAE